MLVFGGGAAQFGGKEGLGGFVATGPGGSQREVEEA